MRKMSAPVLKCSHILTNRQRREIITYKNEAARDHLIRVIRLSLAVRISGSGGIIGHLSENSKGFLMENTNSDDFNMEALSRSKGTAEKENAAKNIQRKIKAALKSKASKQKRTSVSPQKISSSKPQRALPFRLSKKLLFIGSAVIIFIILMGLVIHTSFNNTSNYYLKSAAGAVEIWQGTFSPGGKKRILIMPGVQIPPKIGEVYAKAEVYPLAFNFYVNKADALMEVPGMPDFVGIKSYLNRALLFATTQSLRQTAEARINQIDRMILFYKADVAATKGTRAGLEAALKYLDQVAELNPDDIEAELIKKKKASIRELLKTL